MLLVGCHRLLSAGLDGRGASDRQIEALHAIAEAGQAIADAVRVQRVTGRVWTLYNDTCARTKDGCSDDLENFLADLRSALDGPEWTRVTDDPEEV